ncbi:DUF5819 family protein [Aeromicrobium wangtongii]|uniref:DUF5819 family protein n=1 Tax=Aeromicrobium wangtongii TaxID=2969247 RepID=A0ABY5MDH9_9ACTN|nr:DUF5819 family protein [Aeromicrobium wangtongii]MCD9197292.1 DUF5819 family protein [Aeromicrobium wangtongii]UUP14787.1 DUF5819 family protein [Aeromicrobium wangtongii]
MPTSPQQDESARPRHRWVVEVLLALVAVHSVILALWLAPAGPLRDAVGGNRLASYVDPYFQQGRDVVGVGRHQVDDSFSVRAFVVPDDGGKGTATEWVDLTQLDARATRHDVTAQRARLVARRLATNLNLAMLDLNDAQRRIIGDLTAEDLPSGIRISLEKSGGDPAAVRVFQAYHQMATQFASLYAQAQWDGRVDRVQFRTGRRTVPPVAGEASPDDVDAAMVSYGWRPTFRGSLEAREAFDSFVTK